MRRFLINFRPSYIQLNYILSCITFFNRLLEYINFQLLKLLLIKIKNFQNKSNFFVVFREISNNFCLFIAKSLSKFHNANPLPTGYSFHVEKYAQILCVILQ
jgi:hypothetical protein